MNDVLGELDSTGLLTKRLYNVPVVTQPIDVAWLAVGYEGCYVEDPGPVGRLAGYEPRTIYFPRMTFSGFLRTLRGTHRRPTSMRDVLRHEYGHAFAVEHPSLVRRCRRFVDVFGGRYDDEEHADEYLTRDFVTPYAATSPSEDFAETFMTYVRCGGKTARYRHRAGADRKLGFVRHLTRHIDTKALGHN